MNKEAIVKEPLLRTVKRKERSKKEVMKLRLIALLLSLVAGGIFILLIGFNPIELYGTIISGAFRRPASRRFLRSP